MFRQPETTAQDCVSTFVSLKLLDMFNKTSFVPTEPDVLRCLNRTGAYTQSCANKPVVNIYSGDWNHVTHRE